MFTTTTTRLYHPALEYMECSVETSYFSAVALAGITGGLLLYITERKTAAVVESRPLPQPSTTTSTTTSKLHEGQHMSVMTYLAWCAIGLFIVMVCVNYYLGQIWWLEYLSCFLPVSIISWLLVCGVKGLPSFFLDRRDKEKKGEEVKTSLASTNNKTSLNNKVPSARHTVTRQRRGLKA